MFSFAAYYCCLAFLNWGSREKSHPEKAKCKWGVIFPAPSVTICPNVVLMTDRRWQHVRDDVRGQLHLRLFNAHLRQSAASLPIYTRLQNAPWLHDSTLSGKIIPRYFLFISSSMSAAWMAVLRSDAKHLKPKKPNAAKCYFSKVDSRSRILFIVPVF